MLSFSDLNVQQKEVIPMAVDWYKAFNKPTFEISGPAGSGKTTIVEFIRSMTGLEPDEVLFAAYVGKAAMMLTLAGNPARTIHSTFYYPERKVLLDKDGNPVMSGKRPITYMGFTKKPQLSPNIKLLVIDEGSMVNESFREDILSFGIPVIVLGDLNQLPPVIGRPAFLINPDYRLTMVMRQVEGHPIIKLSQMAIKGQYIKHGKYGDGTYVIPKQMVTNKLMKSSDIIICGRNSTRQNIINHYRKEILGLDTSIKNFVVGEKLICRQNNWGLELIPDSGIYLTNGMIGTVEAIDLSSYNKRSINMSFKPEFSDVLFDNVGMDFKYLFTDVELAPEVRFATDNKFQFAYAITAHLSQGSQYDNVLIIDERLGSRDFYSKWLYTCLTRARRGLALAKD